LPAKVLENRRLKLDKEQNSGKIGENLKKWVSENYNLAYFTLKRWKHFNRKVLNRISSKYAHVKTAERLRYSNRAVSTL